MKTICKNCQEGHIILGVNTYYVTHNMALDACDPSLEGSVFDEEIVWGMCECCEGNFENCKRCEDIERFWSKVDIKSEDECWLWTKEIDKDGYGKIQLLSQKTRVAHRLSWIFTFGEIPDGMFVCHHCDNPSCVNPKHLFLGTQSDNINDMYRKGRGVPHGGEKCAASKLTNEQARQIRNLYASGNYTQADLSQMFKISSTQISYIVNYLAYKDA